VAHVGVQVAEAMEYAAQQGVLHRDIKPSNLLLDVWGNVWLTDFGLAKATGTPDLTRTGDLLGTLRYMAPERFQGHADVRSDVYALGLTLYEALALRPAFQEAVQMRLMQQITAAAPPRLDQLNAQLPRDLVTVVHKAIARDPADRYQTAGALAEDLHRFLEDRPIAARRLGVREQAWRWGRRNPALAALLAALLALAFLATGSVVWFVQDQATRRAEAARQDNELREEVGTIQRQALSFRKTFHFHEARELLDQMRQRLEPAGPDDLRQRLGQARADLNLAARLDAARLQGATLVDGEFDFPGAKRMYAVAFAEAGLDPEDNDVEALVARVRHSAVRAEIVGALDDWAALTKEPGRRASLLEVARRADPDPVRDRLHQPELWRDGAQLARLAHEGRVAESSPQLATALSRAIAQGGGDAEPLLSAAQAHFPNDFWLNYHLAGILFGAKRWDEALGHYRAAVAIRPGAAAVHFGLGATEAATGRPDKAIDHYQRALELDPTYAEAHNNLGIVLRAQRRLDEAIDHFQQTLRIDPTRAKAHYNLGNALEAKSRLDEAIEHYQEAIRVAPNYAKAHNNLGNALAASNRTDEAIVHYEQALRIDPKMPDAHYNLGKVLQDKGRLDEAIAHQREAVRLAPKAAMAHLGLGAALHNNDQLDAAMDEYRQALRLDPKLADAHDNLRQVLLEADRFDEARAATQRWLDLLANDDSQRAAALQQLQRCERLLVLQAKLPAILEGKEQPVDAAELQDLADLCRRYKKRYVAAARFYAAAFAAEPKLADDMKTHNRYNAACAAALAGAGRGTDADKIGAEERARLRGQALNWLTADLAALDQWIKDRPQDRMQARTILRQWQADRDLARLRDAEGLAHLPPEEQETWRKLWTQVDALLQRADAPK
jgi:tetratricopeptide (TPR) repeat protein